MLRLRPRFFSHRQEAVAFSVLLGICVIATMPFRVRAQAKPNIAGDYLGTLGPLHVKLHLKVDPLRGVTGTLDSPDQGADGIPCADFHLDGQALSFTVPAVHGSWKGTVADDGASLSGTWDQGSPMPLNFARDTFMAAAKPSPVDGIWLGRLQAGSTSLRLQLDVKSDNAGREFCAMDSLDQHAMGLECAKVIFAASDFSFDVPIVHGNWKGTLSADGNTLSGVWSQGSPLPLNFARQSVAIAAAPIPGPTYDPALAPAAAADLQSVLDSDLAEALRSGELAPGTGAGVSIAVVEHGVRRVFSYGAAKPDSIFEIGSITKTFTGLVLSQMVEQGKVKFDEPVRELLPPGTVAKPVGAEITLLDLATQHSGLPRMPDNFKPADPNNPYADYGAPNLYAFVAQHGVEKPADAGFLYSNLGFGLLGQALAVRSGLAYPGLLKEEVIDPLGLKDTTVFLSPAQQARFIAGHDEHHHPAHAWDLDAFAGAGAMRSTAADMLTYLEANLHPEKLKPVAGSSAGATLSAALVQSHQLQADAMPGTRIALAWLFVSETGDYWHNGATGGYSSYAFFNLKADYAAVVLFNTTLGSSGSFADRLGQHISQRLAGKPAVSLAK
ncbi:CubicO group peptidase (beta-lactamase class C family) [Edaphobacter aggregans]|uniref:CubicO group peptidase (Beta-lactamase class C family) n=2 Tax=Edaphobacter aggregans TaxID=570835 RepID=A0A3R9PCY0_9BACT|nr:CubicO group peptidase (beta-lactamase class C family) [Edaphobacter aggregans]